MKQACKKEGFKTITHEAELCIIGGGISGICAAVSAARRGIRVVLMHDRPVLGGNASSEIRMHIRGAEGTGLRETGIVEELALENCYRNPEMNYSIWDSVLYGIVKGEKNVTLLMNCSCMDAVVHDEEIKSVTGWQLTTQEYHTVTAAIFADCSGDSILGPLTGAEYRLGREARDEFQEDIAPEQGDNHTMGMSCLIQARQKNTSVTFKAPKWANHYTKEDFPYRINFSAPQKWTEDNFWWMEIGGLGDPIHDTEKNRDELIKIAYGVWDFIKNGGEVDAKNWDLEWMGFLPGKRESRRYVGDYILTQNDIRAEGRFEDMIAYGGWNIDDHHPAGMLTRERPTIHHAAPAPYGIPYRCIYSKNIKNLMFAGRNISTTHTALASTRVMATCGQLGQALGNAAALAIQYDRKPKELYPDWIPTLQKYMMEDGCYLPWHIKELDFDREQLTIWHNDGKHMDTEENESICSKGDYGKEIPVLLDGMERKIGDTDHAFVGEKGCSLVLELEKECRVEALRLVFDSDLNRDTWENQAPNIKDYPMKCHVFAEEIPVSVPKTIVKSFQVSVQEQEGKAWKSIHEEYENYQRLYYVPIHKSVKRVKCTFQDTWGFETIRIYAMEPVGK